MRKAVDILGELANPAAVPLLVRSLGNDAIRDRAAWPLERIGPHAIPHLRQAVPNFEGPQRGVAVRVLDTIERKAE